MNQVSEDTGRIDVSKVKAHIKRTQQPFQALTESAIFDEDEVDVGTKSVILEGRELDLDDSDELTPERVKAVLAETREKAACMQRQSDNVAQADASKSPARGFVTRRHSKRNRKP